MVLRDHVGIPLTRLLVDFASRKTSGVLRWHSKEILLKWTISLCGKFASETVLAIATEKTPHSAAAAVFFSFLFANLCASSVVKWSNLNS